MKKLETKVVQTGEAVKKQETFIKGNEAPKYHANAIIEDDLWHVSKEEKIQERDFDVKSSMTFGGSHWCRPTPSDEHQSMDWDEHRSTLDVHHRSTESVALCKMVRIMTHDEFAAKHPHPPKPFHVNINQKSEQTADRERELTADREPTLVLDRRAPLCYQVQLPKINLARLYALRNPSQPSETPTDNISKCPTGKPNSEVVSWIARTHYHQHR
ncbi:hypothetical protein F2Q69_00046133 [Brassica cretica]|uniref:Uncharacterized protein n=1 Tax=Brassica cretica TaxID=69181 RepID=A0A8S9Q449_BRACR|nr:hypothetical protein F2Q69_00046133 [Brassica cretica]